MNRLDAYWRTVNGVALLLLPLSWLFSLLVKFRRALYLRGIFKSERLPVPVIVIGNITVGGSGKSPLVVWLARHLKQLGYRPGIVARGYGGNAKHWPQQVRKDSDPRSVGDEPVMIARLSGCPMSVGPKRAVAARALLQHHDCNIIISDDGLQHYALARDIEIAVVDGYRRHGNGFSIPAGPLREPVSRLDEVSLIIAKGKARHGEHLMTYQLGDALSVKDGRTMRQLSDFEVRTVHAVAGIGNPDDFFTMLRRSGLKIIEHAFPDHYRFRREDIEFNDGKPVLMTQKDAVKCESFAGSRDWFVPIEAELKESFIQRFNRMVSELPR